eukprot:CAMPEP_0201983960 /NCGR_PEP_ID=MMETSP0904-20121228/82085_1 /ASSEMBLY_ACC=CAM_ASM_000553 /TAXON_ID=420261 /ORGANISM="Thalassiosira antarctica, Strain CCMP982" /LENGTH=452 /DNA_ID=CAMNT_0048537221 /DNA_START=79 /DNA_END=1437 /DNA_ORIENTATION=+
MTITEAKPSTTPSNNNQAIATSVSKTNNVVINSLHRTIRQHTKNKEYNAQTDGLDFLQVKNGLMISYMIDLTLLLRCRLDGNSQQQKRADGDTSSSEEEKEEQHEDLANTQQQQQCLERLLEMKTALEKIRPLEKRMRYQIDKLLALATLGASTFAAVGREQEEEEQVHLEEGDDEGKAGHDGDEGKSDPLSFKPDLQGMMKMFDEDDNEQNDNDSDIESDDSIYEKQSSKPKIALEKDDTPAPGAYQPPRLNSVPFELDNEAALAKQERQAKKQHDRQSRSELTQLLRSQYTDAPDEEDVRGGTLLGKQSEKSRKLAAQDADIQEFEETQMIRLTMGRKEKRARKANMREEMSNLGAIAGGFGSVVGSIGEAFGRGGKEEDGEGDGDFKMKGMRKRKVEILDQEMKMGSTQRRSKKKGATNTYQKSLYEGGGGGGRRDSGGGKSGKKNYRS